MATPLHIRNINTDSSDPGISFTHYMRLKPRDLLYKSGRICGLKYKCLQHTVIKCLYILLVYDSVSLYMTVYQNPQSRWIFRENEGLKTKEHKKTLLYF